VHLTGTVLSLCSDWASGNFSHFLVDALPRLSLVERSPVPLDGIDHYLIPPFEGGEAWVDRLGIPRTRVVWLDPTKEILADTLVVTSYPRPGRACPAWAVEFLRARVSASRGPSREEPPAFLARNSSFRLLANADEIEAIARSKGCRVLVPDAHTDVRRDLATVRAIVGPHGSALTNMVFAPRGARILVLSPSDQPDPFFYAVAVGAGLEFACLVGRSVATRPKGSPGQSPFDFSIEASAFEAALDALLSSRPL
jgi:capsular polysaccharide biosynthesis protein